MPVPKIPPSLLTGACGADLRPGGTGCNRIYEQALAGLLAARRRDLSLVDSASFVLMRRLGIRRALTVDKHFAEQGFDIVPPAAD